MTKSLPKLVLSSSREIPFCQLVLSQKNVRHVKAGLSNEDLADDIYHRTLLQSLNVRAMLDDDGKETGMFEVPAGGRRFGIDAYTEAGGYIMRDLFSTEEDGWLQDPALVELLCQSIGLELLNRANQAQHCGNLYLLQAGDTG